MSIKNEFPEMLRDLWRPSINGSGQWINQVWYEPCHERALYDLLDKIDDKVVELLQGHEDEIGRLEKDAKSDAEEIERLTTLADAQAGKIEDQIQALTVATREHAILQERLKDTLEQFEPPWPATSGTVPPQENATIVASIIPCPVTPMATKEQNGVSRPMRGDGKKVWDIADLLTEMRKSLNEPPAPKSEVVSDAAKGGINASTAAAAYSNWCKFHGINARDTSKPLKVKIVATPEPTWTEPLNTFGFPPPPAFPLPPPFPTV